MCPAQDQDDSAPLRLCMGTVEPPRAGRRTTGDPGSRKPLPRSGRERSAHDSLERKPAFRVLQTV